MQTVSLSFPDETYSSSNKPATTTLKTDLGLIETALNANAASAVETTDADVSANSWVLDEDTMESNSAAKVPTQQSVKAYVDSGTVTMTNKTLTSPVINTGISGTAIVDEDDMSSDSATKVPTQQSVKAYVKNAVYKGYLTEVTQSTLKNLPDNDGTDINTTCDFFALVFLSTGATTSTGATSLYMVHWRGGAVYDITAITEGVAATAPRLVNSGNVLKVKINSSDTQYSVYYSIHKAN